MDILRVLSTPDLEVRKKTLQLALDLVSSRNVEEVKFVFSALIPVFFVSEAYGFIETHWLYLTAGDCSEERSDQNKQCDRT